ncbi:MFS transporter [Halarcobacter sp.]|uniref:MFS transporter n=1 Tax=Halarcobacter sp. TaxID=2321133 RepID=UPI0029F4FDF7|nr:MFS transporter [Halarcobacter sp.]
MPIALIALTLSAFAIGTTEFVTVGLVPTISNDLLISVPSTGLLVTMYAVGVAIGAPILTALSSKYNKKAVLIMAMVVFSLGHIVSALSPNFTTLLLARTITGLTHGLFFSIGATIATGLVSKEKAASAIAVMFGGLTVAMVLGVPLGTYIGQEFGWRNTFFIISLLGTIAFISIIFLLPNNIKVTTPDKFFNQMKILANPKLLIAYLITIFGFGGPFIAFTFLVPILENITNFKSTIISLILLAFGAATIVGNYFGGKFADKFGVDKVLFAFFAALSLTLLSLSFFAHNQRITIFILFLWRIFAFATSPALQANVVKIATTNEPHAVDVASGFNISAFNVGIALWSSVGGAVVANIGLLQTTWISAIIVSLSLILITIGYKLQK